MDNWLQASFHQYESSSVMDTGHWCLCAACCETSVQGRLQNATPKRDIPKLFNNFTVMMYIPTKIISQIHPAGLAGPVTWFWWEYTVLQWSYWIIFIQIIPQNFAKWFSFQTKYCSIAKRRPWTCDMILVRIYSIAVKLLNNHKEYIPNLCKIYFSKLNLKFILTYLILNHTSC